MNYSRVLNIGNRNIGETNSTYFIADIGANHDGDLKRAKKLIQLCAEAGANAAKFQHFKANTIVSDKGFKSLDTRYLSHQSSWSKSVFEVYSDASINLAWDKELKEACDMHGIDYMTTPYDSDLVDHVDPFVPAYKIGSGDITWTDHIQKIASKGKPVILACGASSMDDIVRAVDVILRFNSQLAVLQCNTNYTGNLENFDFINLNVIKTLQCMYPGLCIGLSDHTPGHATAVGAVALGCRIIEKHFTDDNERSGPDHGFAMSPDSWRMMVDTTRELERALGDGIKRIEPNEDKTVVIQRRSVRASRNLLQSETLTADDTIMLRPCPTDALEPWMLKDYLGKALIKDVAEGEILTSAHFG